MTDVFTKNLFAGKVVVVAGGSSGINLGIAKSFAAMGARVCLFGRDEAKATAAAKELTDRGGTAFGCATDVRNYAQVKATFENVQAMWGAVDVIVSGAAGNFVAPAESISANGFRTVVEIDLLGTFHVLRAGFEHRAAEGAVMINISAPQSTHAYPFQAHVCAAKAGIDMLTKSLAMEWGRFGVRVVAIQPGPIADTEGMKRLAPTPAAEKAIAGMVPLGAFGEKNDIANLALFLASPAARYITGAIVPCDGGQDVVGSGGMAALANLMKS